MERKKKILLSVICISVVFILATAISFYLTDDNHITAILTGSSYKNVVLGKNATGSVTREGPYGNVNSPVKIAYIVGVHPRESIAHQAMTQSIKEQSKSLKYCYYIYRVNVTMNASDYEVGRMNGQLLANKYAVPDIIKQKFNLVIDVHDNAGNWEESRFIFSPVNGTKAENISYEITDKLSWLKYYVPTDATSPPYVTIPINKANIPAVVYETYDQDSYSVMKEHATELIKTVDNLQL